MLSNKNIIIISTLDDINIEIIRLLAMYQASVYVWVILTEKHNNDEYNNLIASLVDDNKIKIISYSYEIINTKESNRITDLIGSLEKDIDGVVCLVDINRFARFEMATEKDLIDTFQTNVFSQLIFVQSIIKLIDKQINQKSSIVFIVPISTLYGDEGQTIYCASKAALIGAMKSMSKELGPKGIRVNCIARGIIEDKTNSKTNNDTRDEMIKKMDIPYFGRTIDIADLCMFLISDLSLHITGQVLRVDGGM